VAGVIQNYLIGIKERLNKEIKDYGMPLCYREGHFWIYPRDSFFAMQKAVQSPDGLAPGALYEQPVFVWLPHLLGDVTLKCKNASCKHSNVTLTTKGWNDNPIA
jgi:hypothetical protein